MKFNSKCKCNIFSLFSKFTLTGADPVQNVLIKTCACIRTDCSWWGFYDDGKAYRWREYATTSRARTYTHRLACARRYARASQCERAARAPSTPVAYDDRRSRRWAGKPCPCRWARCARWARHCWVRVSARCRPPILTIELLPVLIPTYKIGGPFEASASN